MSKYEVPKHLKHKPIYAINGYAAVDGYYKNDTDVVGLSIGKAQWLNAPFVASVKVWRRKNKRWSRQSEETTLTRALDMATLVVRVLDKHYNGQPFESVQTIFGELKIEPSNVDPMIVTALHTFLNEHKGDIMAHVDILYDALKTYKENTAAAAGKTGTYAP